MVISKSRKIAINAIFASFSLVLALISRIKAPVIGRFINLDFSDIPIFVLCLLSTPRDAFITLLAVSIIRVLTFDVHSIFIFLLRFSSAVFIPFLSLGKRKTKLLPVFSVISIITYLIIRFPISYAHWCLVRDVPKDWFFGVMVWQINISVGLRTILNIVFANFLSRKFSKNIYLENHNTLEDSI